MSEQLLKAVIHLFALLAMIDGVAENERQRIYRFLLSRLNRESADVFFALFEDYVRKGEGKEKEDEARVLEIVADICKDINRELTLQQKMFLVMELFQLLYADKVISKGEENALRIIREELNISEDVIKEIRTFVTASELSQFNSGSMLIIKSVDEGISTHSHRIITGDFDGFMALLHLDGIKPFFLRYLGHSNIFLNQLPLEYGSVEILPAGSTLRSERFETIYFSDVLGRFKLEKQDVQVAFHAKNLTYKFKNGNIGLRDVSIVETNGRLVGIMGASGSGKSTLFNVLNGNEIPSEGRVIINGIDIHGDRSQVEGMIGYIPQDDLLIEDLTVYENLYYAAKLCYSDYNEAELDELVTNTLTSLGLYEPRNLKVGSPLNKTISGGQRKRLNIGLELLREPLILFVDEPTSGLSSRDSENIMDLLKELTLRGKLIFVVIHQPSSDIFKMFDRLLILDVGGYPIYYGNPVDAVVYFKESANLIDRHEGSCSKCGNVNPEQIFNIIENKVVDEYGRASDQRKITPQTWNQVFKERNKIEEIPAYTKKPDTSLFIPNKVRQTLIFMARDVKAKLNNRQYMLINFLEAPLLAFILAALVRYYTGDGLRPSAYVYQENMNVPAYIFMAIVVALFMGLTVSAEEIIKDRKILKREAFLNLSRGSYLMSKIIMLLVLSAVQVFTFVLVGNLILSIKGMYFDYWLVLFSASFFANMLGLNISSAFNSAVTIYIIIPILLIPQILLSGVVVQFDQLNPTFGSKARVPVIGDVMASRWAYEALMVTQYKDNAFEKQFFDVDKMIAQAEFNAVYYVPQLQSMLEFVYSNADNKSEEIQIPLAKHREVLTNEIEIRLQEVGADKWPGFSSFKTSGLDSALYAEARQFLETLRKMYVHRQTEAHKEREARVQELVNAPDGYDRYQAMIRDYTNDQVTSFVLDNREITRIIEYRGRLVQKIYPIYMDPEPKHPFDYNAQFYLPEKHFAGRNWSTLYFNTAVIWLMSLFLAVMLYYNVLGRIINRSGT